MKTIFPYILCFMFFFALSGFFTKVQAKGHDAAVHGLTVSLEPASIPPGGVSVVSISVPPGAEVRGIRYLKKDFPVFKTQDGKWLSFVGAGLKAAPGRHSLTVKWMSGKEQDVYSTMLPVKKKRYPEEHLKVSRKMVDFPPDILKRVLDDQKAIRSACSKVTNQRYWKGPFIWPVNSKVLSPFGLRRFFNGQPRSPHSGVDLRAAEGTPIMAPNNGRVVLALESYLAGNTLVIDHGGGLFTLYAHLSKFMVKKGEMVKKGKVIGLAGATGRVTGPHLHWGVSLLGTRVDPQAFMEVASMLPR